jgi:hypothetical protein
MSRPPPNSSQGRARGRPPIHGEAWSKVSVVLFDRQVVQLDRMVVAMRAHGKTTLNRAGIIRGLIDGFLDSQMDITTIRSEKELRSFISRPIRSRS